MCSQRIVVMIALAMFLTACATDRPHNEVLIFGTSTKLAVDVSAPVQNAGIPEFTMGYKRQEAVWMPLKPNDAEAQQASDQLNSCTQSLKEVGVISTADIKEACLKAVIPANKYVSFSSGVESNKGGAALEVDTYSVFASFGGSGNLSFSSASGNLAQFFATGIAAQRLGANPAVGNALNAKAPEAEKEKAEAATEKSKEVQALLASGATLEQAERLTSNVPALRIQMSNEANMAMGCVNGWLSANKLPDNLEQSSKDDINRLKTNKAALQDEILNDQSLRKNIIAQCG